MTRFVRIIAVLLLLVQGWLVRCSPIKTKNPAASSLNDIPAFGLGTWLSKREKVSDAVRYALKHGYNHIDAALIYGNEDQVGKGILESGINRSDLWVTSKLWNSNHRPKLALQAIEKSVADLSVEYLDLYLIHWPVAFKPNGEKQKLDHKVSLEDTWRALEDLVRANITRHIGISNFAPQDVHTILDICEICPYAHEFETHPYLQQADWVKWHQDHGIKVIAYSPLANINPVYHSKVDSILNDPFWKDLAKKKKATVPQAVLAWGLQRGTVIIPKSVHYEHLDENLKAKEITFSDEEMAEVAAQDKKLRLNNPSKGWGVPLFKGLDGRKTTHLEYEL